MINEGIARTDGNGKTIQNELALNTAIFHCQQLFKIDKYDSYYSHVEGLIPRKEILMNLYLITGRYQELYNTCCFYTYNGEQTNNSPYRMSNNLLNKEDMSKSFLNGNMRNIHHASFPAVALNHMYLLKKMMHEIMKVLIWVDSQFLSSHDCVATIGEFLGLDREWITFEADWYKNQALEIMQLFVGCKTTEAEFGKLHGHSDNFIGCFEFYFNSGDFQQMKQLVESSLLDTTKKNSHPLHSSSPTHKPSSTPTVEKVTASDKIIAELDLMKSPAAVKSNQISEKLSDDDDQLIASSSSNDCIWDAGLSAKTNGRASICDSGNAGQGRGVAGLDMMTSDSGNLRDDAFSPSLIATSAEVMFEIPGSVISIVVAPGRLGLTISVRPGYFRGRSAHFVTRSQLVIPLWLSMVRR
jgi:hypothetical protein